MLKLFLRKTLKRNSCLVDTALKFIGNGTIRPDTYVIDVDRLRENAVKILEKAASKNVKLYYMSKQIGRNPYIARMLETLGFEGAVCVDYKEAQSLIRAGIKVSHVGHLVQPPKHVLEEIIQASPEIITVYSYEKAKEINEVALKLRKNVNLMLRVIDHKDQIYPSQNGGVMMTELDKVASQIMCLDHCKINGVTAFPCFLFDEKKGEVVPTANVETVLTAKKRLEELGAVIEHVNLPSNTCVDTIDMIAELGGTHGEPGHGLTGTTPIHAAYDLEEIPAIVYASEVSHSFGLKSYFYGGGHYRRSNIGEAYIGPSVSNGDLYSVSTPVLESIDYYFEAEGVHEVSLPVVCAFRTQIFVTRSDVALVEGLATGSPTLVGTYNAQGDPIENRR